MKIEVVTDAKEHDAKAISQGIIAFNKSVIPDLEPNEAEVKFFVFARNNNKLVSGGIRASCYWNTLHIELLWLSEESRGRGIGRKLLEAAEDFAKIQRCEKAFVETTSWQAKPFYEKMNYQLMGAIKDRPKGHTSYFLTKDLT